MTTQPTYPLHGETGPLILAECPFCDQPAIIHDATGALDCAACAVHVELARDREPSALAAAA